MSVCSGTNDLCEDLLAGHGTLKNAIHFELPFWALMDNKSNEWAYATTVNYSFSGCKKEKRNIKSYLLSTILALKYNFGW